MDLVKLYLVDGAEFTSFFWGDAEDIWRCQKRFEAAPAFLNKDAMFQQNLKIVELLFPFPMQIII